MKVQLGVRITPLNGFVNLDCAAQPSEVDRIAADPYKLDEILDNNEIDEVFIVNDTLDFLPLQGRQAALNHWLTKLAHGAKLVLAGNDVLNLARLIHNGQLDASQANAVIYGIGRKSFVHPQDNIQIALATGQFEVEGIKYHNYQYVITLVRK